ncbi:PEP-CTERM sorting domain-containing protein [Haloferula sargassicola]|uniref:Ice-binding protein C-terminal domain-containing protein n=1 Tax=Haloferula sargassicola TaxID=490096 RepID=A0ABP9UNX4_9BACT
MKAGLILSASVLAMIHPATAAVTVTLSPAGSGTQVEIRQTSPNPVFGLDQVTVGFVPGLLLPAAALEQSGGILNESDFFVPSPGTVTDLMTGASSTFHEFSFLFESVSGSYRPFLALENSIELGPGQSHQIALTHPLASTVDVSFSQFIAGTYVFADTAWGEVTTVVVPEPGTACLLAGSLLAFSRRRRA